MSELQRLAELSHCMLMSVLVEVSASKGKDGGVVAKADVSILRGNSPRIGPRPGSLLLFEKRKNRGEFGDEVAPWRHFGQVARGSWLPLYGKITH